MGRNLIGIGSRKTKRRKILYNNLLFQEVWLKKKRNEMVASEGDGTATE